MIWKEGLNLREWRIVFIESADRNPKLFYIFCDAWYFNDNDKTLNTERKQKTKLDYFFHNFKLLNLDNCTWKS